EAAEAVPLARAAAPVGDGAAEQHGNAVPALSGKGLAAPTRPANLRYSAPTLDSGEPERAEAKTSTATASSSEPARNAPCPCGSGKKYKRCHGAPGAH
ncbi:MAG TPA: SEC-C domain-containing protein, partial [Mycobacteriales bacterium]